MRVVIDNGSDKAVKAPYPFGAEIAPGTTAEFHLSDRGIEALSAVACSVACQRVAGVTVRIFKGTPEVEQEVRREGAVPILAPKG